MTPGREVRVAGALTVVVAAAVYDESRREPTASDTTCTGSSTAGVAAMTCLRRVSRRHLNSRLALMPASSAMADTEAPGCRLRSTSSAFNACS